MTNDAVLVTGVGRRLGHHVATQLLERGMEVVGTFRQEREALDTLRALGASLYQVDFCDDASIGVFLDAVPKHHRSLRAVIHNASDWGMESPSQGDTALLRQMMDVHVSAPYRMNFALRPLLEACGEGIADIIHVGDFVSSRGSAKHVAYAASKAAQDNLTLSFAAMFAPKIKVNSIAPALISFRPDDSANYRQAAVQKNLLGHEGGHNEFMNAVDYLLASRYITGRTLPLDGGRHLR